MERGRGSRAIRLRSKLILRIRFLAITVLCSLSHGLLAAAVQAEDAGPASQAISATGFRQRSGPVDPVGTTTSEVPSSETLTDQNQGADRYRPGDTRSVPNSVGAPSTPIKPGVAMAIGKEKPEPVKWKPLLEQSTIFLVIENSYRYGTEEATRSPGRPFFRGYVESVTNLHGWSDGNPFLDNYIGHPIQGSVSGFIWLQNDPRYRNVEFGRNRDYWKSRWRAAAFMWAYSVAEEIGPISEASIGNIQAKLPEQGFVDHVITPTFGLGWLIVEDVLDRYVIRHFERNTNSRIGRILLRGGLNPSRSFANVIGGRLPWARTQDESLRFRDVADSPRSQTHASDERRPGVPSFEIAMNSYFRSGTNGPCLGGGATAAFRIHEQWQIVGDVNGCAMTGLDANADTNLSGDFLSFTVGPRWTPSLSGRWHPYAQLLGGGGKAAQEQVLPDVKEALEQQARETGSPAPHQSQYTRQFETAGVAFTAGVGLDVQITSALAIRIASVEYTRVLTRDLPGFVRPNGIQVRAGLALHIGTW